jgi:hypothetical protein
MNPQQNATNINTNINRKIGETTPLPQLRVALEMVRVL